MGAVIDASSASQHSPHPLVIPAAGDGLRTDTSRCLPILSAFLLWGFWGSPTSSLSLHRTAPE